MSTPRIISSINRRARPLIVLLFILLVNSLLLHNTAFAQSNDKDDIYRMSEERKSELSDVIKYDETTRKLRPKNQAKKKPKKRTPRKTKKRTDWSAAGDIASIFLYAGIAILVLVVLFTVFSNVKLDKKIEDPALLNLEDIEDIETIDAKTGLEIALEAENYREAVRMLFIQLLQVLVTEDSIKWKPKKTNRDYLREMTDHPKVAHFRNLVLAYEQVWYGEHEIDKPFFDVLRIDFERFYSTKNINLDL